MSGINANPDTDWGNVELTDLEATAVPEASTYALLAGFVRVLICCDPSTQIIGRSNHFKRVSMRSR